MLCVRCQGVVWLSSSGSIERDWTFGELYSRICVLSLHLRDTLKIPKGSRAILCFVPCLEFFVAFWACLSQGIVAVPVSPVDPFNPKVRPSSSQRNDFASCFERVADDCVCLLPVAVRCRVCVRAT